MSADSKNFSLDLNKLKNASGQIDVIKSNDTSQNQIISLPEINQKEKEEKSLRAELQKRKIQEEKVILTKLVKKEEIEESPLQRRKINRRLMTVIFLLISGISFLFLYYLGLENSNKFYTGNWSSEPFEAEKATGLVSLHFDIKKDILTQLIGSEKNGIKIQAELEYKIKISSTDARTIQGELFEKALKNVEVTVADSQCADNCQALKETADKDFRIAIKDQFTNKPTEKVEFINMTSDQIQMETESYGLRILKRAY